MSSEKMKPCKTCGQMIAKKAKKCPHCGAKNKKPIYKRFWFWLLSVILIIILSILISCIPFKYLHIYNQLGSVEKAFLKDNVSWINIWYGYSDEIQDAQIVGLWKESDGYTFAVEYNGDIDQFSVELDSYGEPSIHCSNGFYNLVQMPKCDYDIVGVTRAIHAYNES